MFKTYSSSRSLVITSRRFATNRLRALVSVRLVYFSPLMMTSWNGNIFRVTGHLCGEFTSHRCIPHTKASIAELWCFFICAWLNGWVNSGEAGDLRRHRAHYGVTVMNALLPCEEPNTRHLLTLLKVCMDFWLFWIVQKYASNPQYNCTTNLLYVTQEQPENLGPP